MTTWQEIAQKARDQRDASIAAVEPPIPEIDPSTLPLDVTGLPAKLLTAEEVEITTLPPETLIKKLAAAELTAEKVTNAFLRRAGLVQRLVNCITALLPSRALERARYLDSYLRTHGKPIGPLHGLPISVKEHINIKDLPCDAGFVGWRDRVPDQNAHIIDLLLNAGAVLYVRTTQPQTLMHLETSSNLYGETVNGFNRGLTSGGSSGGEGALIGLRGSSLGIGTDIGGSIRSPAANNGVYGFRPTSYRLPMEGLSATMLGQEQIVPVIGPLSTSLEGVKVFMKTLLDQEPWKREPSLLPFGWREGGEWLKKDGLGDVKEDKILKVGVIWDDGVVKPHPPITRALKMVVEKLKEVKGVEVVNWTPWQHDTAWEIISSLYFCDGGAEESAAIASTSEPWRPMSTFILKENTNCKPRSIREVWDLTIKREEYRAEYLKLWGDVDVIMCPAGPGAAPPLNHARYWGYTAQWNLLDYPSLIAPITKVDPALDIPDPSYVPRNEKDKFNHELYVPDRYVNAPVSLQFVGRRYEDEKVIETFEYIKEKVGLPWAEFV